MTTATTERAHRYQRWEGELSKGRWTWLVIVVTGIRLALRERRTRALVITTLVTVLGSCVVLYVLSLLEVLAGTEQGRAIQEFVRGFLQVDVRAVSQVEGLREILWGTLFLVLIKVEMFLVLLIVSLVGPRLIANDLKHQALPIYFAKPVTPLTYVCGKWLVVAAFIAVVTLVPNLVSLIIGTLITGGLHTWGQLLNLGVDLVLTGVLLCAVAGAIVLALSSMSSDSRYVTVAWLAVCLLPVFGQAIVDESLPFELTTGWLGCISLRDNVLTITDWLFGLRQALEASALPSESFANALVKPVKPLYAAVVLAAWTAGAIFVAYWRVVKFSRSAANV
jgi:ABC-type transport system involved in multi-copper enzyme maturation permease subunit